MDDFDEMMGRATRIGNAVASGERPNEDYDLPVGTCQICGRVTADRYCYAGERCQEVGGGEVM